MRHLLLAAASVLILAACTPAATNAPAANSASAANAAAPVAANAATNTASAEPAQPATAPISDPKAYLTGVYAHLAQNGDWAPPEDMFTAHLRSLMADAAHDSDAAGEPGRIDFSPWINGQDGIITRVEISEQPVEQNTTRRIVIVRFDNQGQHSTLRFYWERVGDAWQIDNIDSVEGDSRWDLATVLKYGWASPPEGATH